MQKHIEPEQGQLLLDFARKTIAFQLGLGKKPIPPDEPFFQEERATFVTLKSASKLRGCIGNLTPAGTLLEGVEKNALNAAFHDSRFSALTESEFSSVHLHISILTEPEPLHYTNGADLLTKIRPGIDGVILQDGRHRATFLPQVWEQLRDPEEFLGHLCIKAGLAKESWRDGNFHIETYQAQSFAEVEE